MRFNWRTELPLLLVVLAMFAIAGLTWPNAPEHFPVHWGLHGVDRYGSKFEGILVDPLIALGLYAATLLLPRIDPGRANYAQFSGAYLAIRLVILLFLAAIYLITQLFAYGYHIDVGTVVILMFGGLLIVIGNFMSKVRPNWFVGIRTPWTLSSKLSWDRTHRLGGWAFIAGGLLIIGGVAAPPSVGIAVCLAVPITMVVVLYGYSYIVWKSDPDKQPPAATMPAGPPGTV